MTSRRLEATPLADLLVAADGNTVANCVAPRCPIRRSIRIKKNFDVTPEYVLNTFTMS